MFAGQFNHQRARRVYSSVNMQAKDHNHGPSDRTVSRLAFSGPHCSHRTVRAVMMSRRDMQHNSSVPCWHVAKQGAGLIRGSTDDYIVEDLLDKRSSFHQNR